MIQVISAEQTHPLRHLVLRDGKGDERVSFEGDNAPTSLHLGVFDDHEMLLGVISAISNPHPCFDGQSGDVYQIRGMAVLPELQSAGLGSELLEECLKRLQGKSIWMNARIRAVPFYEKFNFKKWGPVFEIQNIGPHQVLFRK